MALRHPQIGECMDYPFDIFREDLQVAKNALEEEDFRTFSIISNRVMSNAIFGTERKFAIVGFMFREISMLLAQIKAITKPTPYSTALALAKEHLKKVLKDTSSPGFSEATLWPTYAKFLDQIRSYELPEFEAKTYRTDYRFTRGVYSSLLAYLGSNKSRLLNPRNQMLNGILNEMVRVHRSHGGELPEVYVASVMYLLSWCDQYPKAVANSQEEFEKMVNEEILPLVDRAIVALKEPLDAETIGQLVWDLIRRWRYYFIEFMEQSGTIIETQRQKSIPLPEETKKKLSTAITKSLEEQVKKK
jgi:hypothetical protein